MKRINFTKGTQRLIAERAGYKCSFPNCQLTTSGPGADGAHSSRNGIAAHIYSASPGGPRGRGGLTGEEIAKPDNGIWLCSNHAKLIDENGGAGFSPETLLSYKALHEDRVRKELFGLCPLVGWLHEIRVSAGALFAPDQVFRLAKLNLFYGGNGTGKSALVDWIIGTFDQSSSKFARWQRDGRKTISLQITYLNPNPLNISLVSEGDHSSSISIDGISYPFNPLPIKFICPGEPNKAKDDIDLLSQALGLQIFNWEPLVEEFAHLQTKRRRSLKMKCRGKERIVEVSMDGMEGCRSLGVISRGELARVYVELSLAAARLSAKMCPTVLILDGFVSALGEKVLFDYAKECLSPDNSFQTIVCLPSNKYDLNAITWEGWEVIRTVMDGPAVRIHQGPRSDSPYAEDYPDPCF